MNWNSHYNLEGTHASFGASQHAWLNYSDDKAIDYLNNKRATAQGTRLHEWAAQTIDICQQFGMKMPKTNRTIYNYINDAVGHRMDTEVLLYYSDYFYGTADAISFRDNKLRIHDLKTGKIPAHIEQLEIYAALFCLEYHIKPAEIDIELRLYQNDDVVIAHPQVDDIVPIMDKIVHLTKILREAEG